MPKPHAPQAAGKPDGRGVFSAGGKRIIKSVMLKVLVAQTGVGAAVAVVLWSMYGDVAGYSALLGSLISVIPNAFLALRLAVPRQDPGAEGLVRAAYIGELGKLALTVLFFGLVFTLVKPLSAAALFAGFIATQLVTVTGLLMQRGQERDKSNGNGS
jgi:ATP synthase protein I